MYIVNFGDNMLLVFLVDIGMGVFMVLVFIMVGNNLYIVILNSVGIFVYVVNVDSGNVIGMVMVFGINGSMGVFM